MRTRFLKVSLLCALFATGVFVTGCSDDNGYADVDGQSPVAELKADHIRSGAGHDFTIEGTLTDEDGISFIRLECKDLYLNKTIDLIEIYGEPKKTYDLSYSFALAADELGEQFTVKVTVVDVGGRETSQDVLITMDGDFEIPVFVKGPSEGGLIPMILEETEDGTFTVEPYVMELEMSDDRGLKSLQLDIEGAVGYEDQTIDLGGLTSSTYTWTIDLPAVKKDYEATLIVTDKEEKADTISCTISVTDVVDFPKMYLADVPKGDVAALTSDVFGVPMVINHTGEYQYKERYYNKAAGTEIYFLSDKSNFSPVCYGLDPADNTKLLNDPDLAEPFVLNTPNVYYEITLDILMLTYTVTTYTVDEATNPMGHYVYGEKCFDRWENGNEADFIEFYIGWGSSPQDAGNHLFVQDKSNPHLFYYPAEGETWSLGAGEDLNFIISNNHPDGWWDHVEWRCDNSDNPEKFGYFSKKNDVNPNWEGTNRQWEDGTAVNDNWISPTVTNAGNYRFEFDAHLGRGKIVPAN